MASRRSENLDCRLYVGELPHDIREKDIDNVFNYYGPLKSIWLAHNPPGFAFVEFTDPLDAQDAVKGLHGTKICGSRARVEHAMGRSRSRRDDSRRDGRRGRQPSPRRNGGRNDHHVRRAFNPNDRCFVCDERGHYSYDCPRKNGSTGSGGSHGEARNSDGSGGSRGEARGRCDEARNRGGESRRRRSPFRSRSRSPGAPKRREYSRSPMRSRRDRSP